MPAGDESHAGHRLVAHTADLIVEAWAPQWDVCLIEAVRALVESFVDPHEAEPARDRVAFEFDAQDPEGQLVALLEEVIYLLDAEGVVPTDVEIDEAERALSGRFAVAPTDALTPVGPAPKAVALHGLAVHEDDAGWSCRVLVDV